MIDNNYKDLLIKALKDFSKNPDAIDNFESYLDRHFDKWCEIYASDAKCFIWELSQFSQMEI